METAGATLEVLDKAPMLATSLAELPFGSQSQIKASQGSIAAFLAFAGEDRRSCSVRYALRVLNNSPFPVRARLYCLDVKGVRTAAYPRDVHVAPYSMRDDLIPIRLDVVGPYDRALVEVTSEDTFFTVEAPAPPRPPRKWLAWCAGALVPVLLAATAAGAYPRIVGVDAPAKAVSGSTIQVPYQVAGIGSVEYDFRTKDGLQIAAGITNARQGLLRLKIPDSGAGAPYTLRVRLRNALSSQQTSASIAMVAVKTPSRQTGKQNKTESPLISDLSVDPSPAQAGKSIQVRYAMQAAKGEVWLVDMYGRTWAHADASPSGLSTIAVPQAAAGRDLRVVLYASNNKQRVQSSVGVTVLPSQSVANAKGSPENGVTRQPRPQAGLSLSSQVATAGQSVTVQVAGAKGDVKITLETATGTAVSQGDISEGGGSLSIAAPDVSAVTSFFVVANFTDGVAQQSIVRRLVVTPR